MDKSLIMKKQKTNNATLIVVLILSFVWINIFESLNFSVGGYAWGNILDSSGNATNVAVSNLFISSLAGWLTFEIICYFYRFILSFKIYSFVVPQRLLTNECRKYFIYRNLFLGIFTNLCFIFPYLYGFTTLVGLVITMLAMICFALNLSKKYSESIISHFVFKCFCFPIILYEALVIISEVWRLLV